MYPAISTNSLMKIPIALPDEAVRRHIVAKVQESFDTRREASRLMEAAKTMVEKAILQGCDHERVGGDRLSRESVPAGEFSSYYNGHLQ
jgi:hypothetical protein